MVEAKNKNKLRLRLRRRLKKKNTPFKTFLSVWYVEGRESPVRGAQKSGSETAVHPVT